MPDATAGETVRAVVVREHSTLTSDELREWSRQKLAAYKVPRQVMFVSEVPKSPIGKILRKDVRAAQHTAPPEPT